MIWAAGECNLIFYADERRMGGRYHISLQYALAVSVVMFRWVGLKKNLYKTKALVCTPGYIWEKWSESKYKRRDTGEGEISGRGSGGW